MREAEAVYIELRPRVREVLAVQLDRPRIVHHAQRRTSRISRSSISPKRNSCRPRSGRPLLYSVCMNLVLSSTADAQFPASAFAGPLALRAAWFSRLAFRALS